MDNNHSKENSMMTQELSRLIDRLDYEQDPAVRRHLRNLIANALPADPLDYGCILGDADIQEIKKGNTT